MLSTGITFAGGEWEGDLVSGNFPMTLPWRIWTLKCTSISICSSCPPYHHPASGNRVLQVSLQSKTTIISKSYQKEKLRAVCRDDCCLFCKPIPVLPFFPQKLHGPDVLWNCSLETSSGSWPLLPWCYNDSSYLQAQWLQFLPPRAWGNLVLLLAVLCRQAANSTADWHDVGSSTHRPSLRLSLAFESHPGMSALVHFRGVTQPQPPPPWWLQQREDYMLAAGSALVSALLSLEVYRTPFCHILMTAQRWEWDR